MRRYNLKKFAIVFSIIIWLLILTPLGFIGYVMYQLHAIEKDTYEYLLEKYEEDEILSIDTSLSKGSFHYSANVIFKDEPHQIYEYIKYDGKIIQAYPDPEPDDYSFFKHLEKAN